HSRLLHSFPTRRSSDLLARVAAAALLMSLPGSLTPQQFSPTVTDAVPARVPFGVGEMLEYDVKYGFLHVGSGSMEVAGIDSVRGAPAWHTVFRVRGGNFAYRVDDRLESWIDTRSFASLRFWQDLNEGRRETER